MKSIFTTGQVAKICNVAPRTVTKWFDCGRLKGYRVPGSQARRIPQEHLVRFLKEYGMPLGHLEEAEAGRTNVLLVCLQHAVSNALTVGFMRHQREWFVDVANSQFEAGVACDDNRPDAIVVDVDNRPESDEHFAGILRERFPEAVMVKIGAAAGAIDGTGFICKPPVEAKLLVEALDDSLNLASSLNMVASHE